jgi:hypothetical protein
MCWITLNRISTVIFCIIEFHWLIFVYKVASDILYLTQKAVSKKKSYYAFFEMIWFWFLVFNFQQYFSYIMTTSFSGGRSQSTRREPPTMGKQLVNFITCGCESSAPFL